MKLTVLVAVPLLALACGQAAPPPATAPEATPKQGGTINLRMETDPFNWDVSRSVTNPNSTSTAMAYSTLLEFNKNFTGTNDPELNRLVEASRVEADPIKRREIVPQAYVKGFSPEWNIWAPRMVNVWLDK